MRQHAIGNWLVRAVFILPLVAAGLLLGSLGLMGIATWCGAVAICDVLLTVFLGLAVGLLAVSFLIKATATVAAALGLIVMTIRRAALGATLLVRMALRGL
jgi:hypothetical protein